MTSQQTNQIENYLNAMDQAVISAFKSNKEDCKVRVIGNELVDSLHAIVTKGPYYFDADIIVVDSDKELYELQISLH